MSDMNSHDGWKMPVVGDLDASKVRVVDLNALDLPVIAPRIGNFDGPRRFLSVIGCTEIGSTRCQHHVGANVYRDRNADLSVSRPIERDNDIRVLLLYED